VRDRIVLLDETGKEQEFELIATFGLEESDYAVLFPLDDISEDYLILRMEYNENDEMFLAGIDDEELNDAIEAYESIMKRKLQ
jgi:uncharacterized protein YrzB (UPF0473 family)